MGRPSKPMAKNSNSKFTTRNNKQDIFSKMAKASKQKAKSDKPVDESDKLKSENND